MSCVAIRRIRRDGKDLPTPSSDDFRPLSIRDATRTLVSSFSSFRTFDDQFSGADNRRTRRWPVVRDVSG